MSEVIVLGAGMAGLSAGHALSSDFVILEAGTSVGGLSRSQRCGDFIFDLCGHVLHGSPDAILARTRPGALRLTPHRRRAGIHIYGRTVSYPFQGHFYDLTPDVVRECAFGLLRARSSVEGDVASAQSGDETFEDWILDQFGDGIARHFMFPYNTKLWTVHPRDMTAAQVRRFVPIPSPPEVIESLNGGRRPDLGYNRTFFYPEDGGFQVVADAVASPISHRIHLGQRVTQVNLKARSLRVDHSEERSYDTLISTIPLPELVRITSDAPASARVAAAELPYSRVVTVQVGVHEPLNCDCHWLYFPERQFSFYRTTFPSNINPRLAPDGRASITAEISIGACQGLELEVLKRRTLADLAATGIISTPQSAEVLSVQVLPYGYPIALPGTQRAVSCILDFYERHRIFCAGRFGRWHYASVHDCWNDGIIAARAASPAQPRQ